MRVAVALNHPAGFKAAVPKVVQLEKVGLDIVWIGEGYSFDSISQVGYLAAKTKSVRIGTGIVNAYSRTPALLAMTAAGCDYVSDGRFILGLGLSGPLVIEGFHGVPFDQPAARVKEYTEACRMVWRREPLVYDGRTVHVPLPAKRGIGPAKPLKLINDLVRREIPVWWASLKDRAVEATARFADGWLPQLFDPERFAQVWERPLKAGLAKRDTSLAPFEICAGGILAIDDSLTASSIDRVLDSGRASIALAVGGLGPRGHNFYNDVAQAYGYEAEAVSIQRLYLDGKKAEAAAAVPAQLLRSLHLVGPKSLIKERVGMYMNAGVTVLQVDPVWGDPVRQIETLKGLIEDCGAPTTPS